MIKLVDFRPFSWGGIPTLICLLRFYFFIIIFLVAIALPHGSSMLVLKMFCDNLAIFGRSLKNTHMHQKVCRPISRLFRITKKCLPRNKTRFQFYSQNISEQVFGKRKKFRSKVLSSIFYFLPMVLVKSIAAGKKSPKFAF